MQRLRLSEYFVSIQGEGPYAGVPALFLRCSGCNATPDFSCWRWCDTPQKNDVKYELTVDEVVSLIRKYEHIDIDTVIFTGGEPTLQMEVICEISDRIQDKYLHLETNGTYLVEEYLRNFDFIAFSPKREKELNAIVERANTAGSLPYTIVKIVCSGKNDKRAIDWATRVEESLGRQHVWLMPLTTGDEAKDKQIMQEVWDLCVEQSWNFSPRLHIWVGRR